VLWGLSLAAGALEHGVLVLSESEVFFLHLLIAVFLFIADGTCSGLCRDLILR
jgi:hypothetical protein